MSPEFGHFAAGAAGYRIDGWGTGPFLLTVDGKQYRFEDSDRFGPVRLLKNGEPSEACPWWPERHPFWRAHRIWKRQGRRLAEDGRTCIWDEPKPTLLRYIGGRHFRIIEQGEEDGAQIVVPT